MDDSRPTGSELRRLAREQLRTRDLPDGEPAAMQARSSRGDCSCALCGASLEAGELEFRLYFDGALTGRPFCMHGRCYAIWVDERLWMRARTDAVH